VTSRVARWAARRVWGAPGRRPSLRCRPRVGCWCAHAAHLRQPAREGRRSEASRCVSQGSSPERSLCTEKSNVRVQSSERQLADGGETSRKQDYELEPRSLPRVPVLRTGRRLNALLRAGFVVAVVADENRDGVCVLCPEKRHLDARVLTRKIRNTSIVRASQPGRTCVSTRSMRRAFERPVSHAVGRSRLRSRKSDGGGGVGRWQSTRRSR
jgi:hypothetical protein